MTIEPDHRNHRQLAEQYAAWAEDARRAADNERKENVRSYLLQAATADAVLAIYHELRHSHDHPEGGERAEEFGSHGARTSDILPPRGPIR
ncbi:hypothetical protein [Streptoalloteichus hindustanus]|uniref:Uncharacterized protein n=1 Tax=Streptoalloteichus hindustanus TaxID=2017 RepID=A0A1M4VMD8_STRHI|nr:hypothetical protein [Streptoalloteichus hindustanus]SHE70013.1 hypothetical protein SAMN05444320_101817 [Streptoalloteichus hindustanus]